MYEELFISGKHESTEVKKIFTADEVMLDWNQLEPRLAELGELARTARRQELRSALLDLAFSGERELPTTQTTCATELDENSLLPHSTNAAQVGSLG